ncbi:MAG TPA: hypothetical protein VFH38_00205 [Jatrophihabitans sp.]|nr:hypothetical protein [Jatrophihabitans sp.]
MGINEPFRCIVSGHRRLLAIFVIVPLALVAALTARGTENYVATSRIQATSDTLGSDTEADSVLNHVRGIATSTDTVRRALSDAGVSGRNPVYVADHEIALSRLGSSAVVDIAVTDRSAADARALADALAREVVRVLQGVGSTSSDALLARMHRAEKALLEQRGALVLSLGEARTPSQTANLSAQLSSLDQQLSDLSGAVQQLEVSIATNSSAAVISPAGAAKPASSGLTLRLVLAGIGGLVAGLLVAALLEILRPRLADARAVARELGAPVLGTLVRPAAASRGGRLRRAWALLRSKLGLRRATPGTAPDAGTVLALRRAAAGAHVGAVALVGAVSADEAARLAGALTKELSPAPAARNGRARTEPAPSPRGPGGVLQASRTRTQAATRQIVASPVSAGLRVTTVDEIGAGTDERYGLLVAARSLMPATELGRVSDLAAATGWPVLGVLDVEA